MPGGHGRWDLIPAFTGNHSVYWSRPHDEGCINMDTRNTEKPIRMVEGEMTPGWPRFGAKDMRKVLLVVADASMQKKGTCGLARWRGSSHIG